MEQNTPTDAELGGRGATPEPPDDQGLLPAARPAPPETPGDLPAWAVPLLFVCLLGLWRGGWNLMDIYLGPSALSNWLSAIGGVGGIALLRARFPTIRVGRWLQ